MLLEHRVVFVMFELEGFTSEQDRREPWSAARHGVRSALSRKEALRSIAREAWPGHMETKS